MIHWKCPYCMGQHTIDPTKKPLRLRRDLNGKYPINPNRFKATRSRNDAIEALRGLGWTCDEIASQLHLTARTVYSIIYPDGVPGRKKTRHHQKG